MKCLQWSPTQSLILLDGSVIFLQKVSDCYEGMLMSFPQLSIWVLGFFL